MAIEFGPAFIDGGASDDPEIYDSYVGFPVTGVITTLFGVVDALHSIPHSGVDIAAPSGTPIYAPAPGIVADIALDTGTPGSGVGNAVTLVHDDGSVTIYLHMVAAPPVIEGEFVARGEVIGHVGSTGRSTGPHLHWTHAPSRAQLWDRDAEFDPFDSIVSELTDLTMPAPLRPPEVWTIVADAMVSQYDPKRDTKLVPVGYREIGTRRYEIHELRRQVIE